MAIVVAGLNYKSAPIALLERLAIPHDRLPKALGELSNRAHVLEGVILSTCNRVEVYAAVTKFHGGAQDLRDFLAEFCHVAPEDFVDRMYTYHDDAALRHLFRVAAGVDSMVLGESEILGQLRRALSLAREEGVVRRELETAFLYALRAGRRARAETGIGRHPASISSAAVELARQTFGSTDGSLAARRVLVLGAGKMGRLAADALRRAGVTQVVVVNRTEERAHALADSFGVTALPIAELPAALVSADVMICSTGTAEPLVDSDLVRQVMSRRADRPLLIVDIGVPRNVDAAVVEVPGVSLRYIDALREVTGAATATRLGELPKVERIVSEEIEG
ncbi:MAG: glutamyl-tRNA reductase, partial [Actinomycetota bacterium]|nr:glutamyl-tRNA reductase [Actinomycetota bacterium]